MLQNATINATPLCCNGAKDWLAQYLQNVAMSKKTKHPKNFLRAWREFRGLTQEQVAAQVKPPTNASVLSLLENQGRDLSNGWMHRLAPVLKVRPGWLADVDPYSEEARLWMAWQGIPEGDKPRGIAVLEALKNPA